LRIPRATIAAVRDLLRAHNEPPESTENQSGGMGRSAFSLVDFRHLPH
jgi:hypothetical protein